MHLLRHGWQVRVVREDGLALAPLATGIDGEISVLEALAVTDLSDNEDVSPAAVRGDLVVAIICADARAIAAMTGAASRTPGQLGLAVVLDTGAWWVDDALLGQDAARELTACGWRATAVGPGTDVPAAWQEITSDAATLSGARR